MDYGFLTKISNDEVTVDEIVAELKKRNVDKLINNEGAPTYILINFIDIIKKYDKNIRNELIITLCENIIKQNFDDIDWSNTNWPMIVNSILEAQEDFFETLNDDQRKQFTVEFFDISSTKHEMATVKINKLGLKLLSLIQYDSVLLSEIIRMYNDTEILKPLIEQRLKFSNEKVFLNRMNNTVFNIFVELNAIDKLKNVGHAKKNYNLKEKKKTVTNKINYSNYSFIDIKRIISESKNNINTITNIIETCNDRKVIKYILDKITNLTLDNIKFILETYDGIQFPITFKLKDIGSIIPDDQFDFDSYAFDTVLDDKTLENESDFKKFSDYYNFIFESEMENIHIIKENIFPILQKIKLTPKAKEKYIDYIQKLTIDQFPLYINLNDIENIDISFIDYNIILSRFNVYDTSLDKIVSSNVLDKILKDFLILTFIMKRRDFVGFVKYFNLFLQHNIAKYDYTRKLFGGFKVFLDKKEINRNLDTIESIKKLNVDILNFYIENINKIFDDTYYSVKKIKSIINKEIKEKNKIVSNVKKVAVKNIKKQDIEFDEPVKITKQNVEKEVDNITTKSKTISNASSDNKVIKEIYAILVEKKHAVKLKVIFDIIAKLSSQTPNQKLKGSKPSENDFINNEIKQGMKKIQTDLTFNKIPLDTYIEFSTGDYNFRIDFKIMGKKSKYVFNSFEIKTLSDNVENLDIFMDKYTRNINSYLKTFYTIILDSKNIDYNSINILFNFLINEYAINETIRTEYPYFGIITNKQKDRVKYIKDNKQLL